METVTTVALHVAVAVQLAVATVRERFGGDTGELSSQQVIWIATLATIAVAVGGIIASKVTAAANSLDLGGAG